MDKASHTNSGDIDSKRLPSFLLGVVLALSILYVALEYTSISQPYPTDDSLDEMVQDIDMQTPATQPDMMAATQPDKPDDRYPPCPSSRSPAHRLLSTAPQG